MYAYEFIPSNVDVFQKNLDLNPVCKEIVTIIKKAVWSTSNLALSYCDTGPSSRVGEAGKYSGSTNTLSIDDLTENVIKGPVNFIKMDIEGAEVPALEGARKTIEKYGPQLAISVYHKPDDLYTIPKLIKGIRGDYKFYLDYYTSVGYEIVLYAVLNQQAVERKQL